MTQQNSSLRAAVLRVLGQRPNESLHYQHDVTNQISEQGLFAFNAANPAGSVSNTLRWITDPEHDWHDPRVQKTGRGWFMLTDASLPDENIVEEPDEELDEPIVNDTRIVGISAYGLYWEREKVRWNGTATRLLGRQTPGAKSVDFAEQLGVYVLHNNQQNVYVGRTTRDSLQSRLVYHNNPSNHSSNQLSFRWKQFSWFGFRDVDDNDDTPKLKPMPSRIDAERFLAIMETVLIEALAPPINGRRGDYLGPIYQQVEDPYLASLRSETSPIDAHSVREMIASALLAQNR